MTVIELGERNQSHRVARPQPDETYRDYTSETTGLPAIHIGITEGGAAGGEGLDVMKTSSLVL